MNKDTGSQPEIIRAEVVEVMPAAPWEWREVRPVRPVRLRWRRSLVLFLATCLSTLYVGSLSAGPTVHGWLAVLHGLHYAVPVMIILLCHEMGHFVQARHYGVSASLPYFLPIPYPPFGTFGAVIFMEPRVGGRRSLFDIGISGPLAGLAPTLIFLIVGLHHSAFAVPSPDTLVFGEPRLLTHPIEGAVFGEPLLFVYLAKWVLGPTPLGMGIAPDPMAFAGWVGLFITSLNLIPIGQLDGGHVLYALLRKKAHKVATLLLFGAMFLVIVDWRVYGTWVLMVILLFLMGPIHPPTADDEEPLGAVRIVLGWLTLAFILIGFTRVPIILP